MTKTPHVHKLKRIRYKSGNEVFFCALPDCPCKMSTKLALGKRSLCWRCGEPFIMTDYSIRLAKPHCEGCHKPKEEKLTGTFIDIVGPKLLEGNLELAKRLEQTIQQVTGEDEL